MKTETRRQVAERVADSSILRDDLIDEIEKALNAGYERCARIADKYAADMRSVTHRTEYGEGCLHAAEHIASEIRGKQ